MYLGAGEGPPDFDNTISATVNGWQADTNQMDWVEWARTAFARMQPKMELEQEPNLPSGHIARLFRLRGPKL